MFAFIRRHPNIGFLFMLLVAAAMVVYLIPNSKSGRGGREANYGTVFGQAISAEEYTEAKREAHLQFFLRYGSWPGQDAMSRQLGFNAERETMHRLVLNRKAQENNIRVGDEAVAAQIADFFRDPKQKKFDPQTYERYVKERLPSGVTRADFENFIRHEVAKEQLITMAGLGGELATPREAEARYRQEHEEAAATLVVFNASNHLAAVTLDPAAIGQFYTNREAVYRIPERVQVSYVRFDASNYVAEADQLLAKATNLAANIDRYYQQQGATFFKDDKGLPLTAEAAKAKILTEEREKLALVSARKAANELATELFALPPKADSLPKLAAAKGFEAKVTEPFTEFEPPAGLRVFTTFNKAAFALTAEEPFVGPQVGESGAYVIALNGRLPSVVPPLEAIRERVTEDYRKVTARELARQAGQAFAATLTNGLAQGKTFAAQCLDARLMPLAVPPFSTSTRSLPQIEDRVSLGELKAAAAGLVPGKASDFRASRDGGFILYLQSRLPLDEAKLKTELPAYLTELRQERQYVAFNEWLLRQVKLAGVKLTGGDNAGE